MKWSVYKYLPATTCSLRVGVAWGHTWSACRSTRFSHERERQDRRSSSSLSCLGWAHHTNTADPCLGSLRRTPHFASGRNCSRRRSSFIRFLPKHGRKRYNYYYTVKNRTHSTPSQARQSPPYDVNGVCIFHEGRICQAG